MSSRAPIGHLAINTVPVCTNQGCKSFVPKPELTTRYLYWALRGVMPEIQHLGDGCTFDEVSKTDLEAFEIPVPPLAEQRRLVARIEALTSRLEEAHQARQASLAEADNLLTIAQRSEYERLLVDEETTPVGKVGEVISGGTPSKSVEGYWGGDVPWIAPKEMKRFRIGESSLNVTQRAVDVGAAKLDQEWDHRELCRLWRSLSSDGLEVRFDFSCCRFLRQNAVAFLGGLARLLEGRGGRVEFAWDSLQPSVAANLRQNGFTEAFSGPGHSWLGNSIPYIEHRQASAHEYADYLSNRWLGQGWIGISRYSNLRKNHEN